jgi:hypothetical protein
LGGSSSCTTVSVMVGSFLADTTALLELTPRDVVGHLMSAELDDWIPRAELILVHGTDRPFEPFDRFAHVGPWRAYLGILLRRDEP